MIRVLVVEDEPVAAAAHRTYVDRVPGFEVVTVAHTAADAASALAHTRVDLILLDMRLPDGHGLDVVRRARARGLAVDVIAVTSVRDLDVVRRAMSQGVTHYLLKPFTFAGLRARLTQYAEWRAHLDDVSGGIAQADVDRIFDMRRAGPTPTGRPKGLTDETLAVVTARLRDAGTALTASALGDAVGTSRVTARRYLEHLVEEGVACRQIRHGGTGRPEVLYRWSPE